MPQIDLNTRKSKGNKTGGSGGLTTPWGNAPWGDDFSDPRSEIDTQTQRMTPQERVSMIEKVYEEVLGRKPDTRDVNYYKYSTLSEDEIRRQLLAGKEHRQLVEDGREFKKMRERATQAETKIKMLEAQNTDQLEEFKHLTKLLKEKNNYIQDLRSKLKNPYNITESHLAVPQPEAPKPIPKIDDSSVIDGREIFTTANTTDSAGESKQGILDRIKNIITP